MVDVIDWLKRVERLASDVYAEAADCFMEDETFSRFLRSLSEDEAWHYHLMNSAAELMSSTKEFSPFSIKVGEDTIERVEIPLRVCQDKIRSGEILKQDVIRCIVDTEFTEWNDIFTCVMSVFRQHSRTFQRIASSIQIHEKRISKFLDSLPKNLFPGKNLQELPKIWEYKHLIVDDEKPLRKLLQAAFCHEADVITAENGKEALEKIQNSFFDIVVSDIDMPVMDGIELFEFATEFDPEIKRRFVFCSGNVTPEIHAFCSRNKLPILEKPFIISELKSVIERQILATSAEPAKSGDAQEHA